jgi:hypothetical protein
MAAASEDSLLLDTSNPNDSILLDIGPEDWSPIKQQKERDISAAYMTNTAEKPSNDYVMKSPMPSSKVKNKLSLMKSATRPDLDRSTKDYFSQSSKHKLVTHTKVNKPKPVTTSYVKNRP